mgnify:CR=1 FL=1
MVKVGDVESRVGCTISETLEYRECLVLTSRVQWRWNIFIDESVSKFQVTQKYMVHSDLEMSMEQQILLLSRVQLVMYFLQNQSLVVPNLLTMVKK